MELTLTAGQANIAAAEPKTGTEEMLAQINAARNFYFSGGYDEISI